MDPAVGGGLLLTAGVLGFTHGIEPDHLAGILALTHESPRPLRSMLVGTCFAIGHVVLVVAWIGVAYLLFEMTGFPAQLEVIGLLVVGLVLSLLGVYLGYTGTRKLVHKHTHDHGGQVHSHYHVHGPARLVFGAHVDHEHRHGTWEYLKIGLVGAMFTLSPPLSMIAFISVAMANPGPQGITSIVLVYTIAITGTMALVGAGAGSLFHVVAERGERYYAYLEILASVFVFGIGLKILVENVPLFWV